MEKIIHKLDKKSRYQIAINYVNNKHKDDINHLTNLMNSISTDLIHNYHSTHDESSHNELCSMLDKFNINTNFYSPNFIQHGLVASHLQSGNQSSHDNKVLPLPIFSKNQLKFDVTNDDFDCTSIINSNLSSTKKTYSHLISKNNSTDMLSFIKGIKTLKDDTYTSFHDCYELLKKVRTAELLMKHWSDAFHYLPDDLEIDSPNAVSISEKFALLGSFNDGTN